MSFSYKKSIYFSNLNDNNINLNALLINNIVEDTLYKIDIIKHKNINFIGNYEINVQNNGIISSEFQYPESGHIIHLSNRNI